MSHGHRRTHRKNHYGTLKRGERHADDDIAEKLNREFLQQYPNGIPQDKKFPAQETQAQVAPPQRMAQNNAPPSDAAPPNETAAMPGAEADASRAMLMHVARTNLLQDLQKNQRIGGDSGWHYADKNPDGSPSNKIIDAQGKPVGHLAFDPQGAMRFVDDRQQQRMRMQGPTPF